MSEPVVTEVTVETEQEAPETAGQDVDSLPQWARDAIKKANTEAAKSRVEKKELAEARAAKAELDKIREAQKSDDEKRTERLSVAERERDEARSEVSCLRIAARHGISEEDLDLLGSGTDEEIEARAKRIAAKNAAAAAVTAVAPLSGKPTEKLRPGATPSDVDLASKDAYPAHWRPRQAQKT